MDHASRKYASVCTKDANIGEIANFVIRFHFNKRETVRRNRM